MDSRRGRKSLKRKAREGSKIKEGKEGLQGVVGREGGQRPSGRGRGSSANYINREKLAQVNVVSIATSKGQEPNDSWIS